MVKVISAYNFQQQNTYSVSGDIAATCLIGPDRLAIAHRIHLIEILALKRKTHSAAANSGDTAPQSVPGAGDNFQSRRCFIDQNENCHPNKIAFPTIDQVEQMIYCASDNYILTLERKAEVGQDRMLKHRTLVRAYTNFDIASSVDDCFSIPIRARIASKTTPNNICNDHVEVIEIPINGPSYGSSPHLMTCCQTAGTIAVCIDQRIHFFESRYRTNDANKFQFIDFFEAPFYVELDFKPFKIALAEHIVACMDNAIVAAFKIVDLSDIGTEDGTTTNSVETDSSANMLTQHNQLNNYNRFHSNYRRNRAIDFEVAKQYNQANGIKFQSDLRSNWDRETDRRSSFSEDRPFLVNDVKIVLKVSEHIPNDRIFYSIRSLVQLRLHKEMTQKQVDGTGDNNGKSTGMAAAIHDEFRCLALKPLYFKLNQDSEQQRNNPYDLVNKCSTDGGHIMKSSYHTNCVGFSLFITTVSDGYVYQFTNQGKWYTENTKCLAVYPFTSPVVDIVIDNFVIHAITESGIETFSSRIGHKLFSSYFEYPMINDPYPNEASPLVDVPICVMGICGFFGIKHVASSSQNLVLLTTDSEPTRRTNEIHTQKRTSIAATTNTRRSNNSINHSNSRGNNNAPSSDILDWTIYDLELPKPEIIVDDIEHLACIYRQTSPEIYYELVEEAHVIIRLARELLLLPCYDSAKSTGNCVSQPNREDYNRTLNESYKKTCKMLADFTIQSSRKETYSLAVAYYTMCKQTLQEIYSSYRETTRLHGESNIGDHAGLMYTLTLILSQIGSNKSGMEYLTQNVASICLNGEGTPNNYGSVDHTFAEELFELYLKYSPNDLTHIALSSSVFRELLNDYLLKLYSNMGNIEALSPEQKMCFVLCLSYQNKTKEALNIFESFRRSHLYTVLHDYWSQILFENLQLDNYRKCTFSDLTESILFLTERNELIEAVADVMIRISTLTRSVDLNFIIKLFMNYFAMNVGCPGYRTSQKVLEIVLQAYFYDYFKYTNRNVLISPNGGPGESRMSPREPQQNSYNVSEVGLENENWQKYNYKSSTGYQNQNRKNSSQLSDNSSTSTTVDSNYEDPEFEAMKILCRMYLGLLKQHTTNDFLTMRSNIQDLSTILPDTNGYRLAFIDFLYTNKGSIKSAHAKFDTNSLTHQQIQMQHAHIVADYHMIRNENATSAAEDEYWRKNPFHRPIVFFERRENFLNKMPPLCLKTDVNGVPFSNNWDEVSLVLIKIQSLLNSGKLDSSLIEDVITFIHSNPNVIGVDSLLTILLPRSEGIELLIHTNPQYLLDYVKMRLTTAHQWQILFKRILSKKRELDPNTQQAAIELYDRVVEDILRHLVATKSLDDFLECIPEQEIHRNEYTSDHDNSYWKLGKCRTQTQDGIDETNPFEIIMREAVIKQRSDALDAMIQSSGRQLNDAVNNFQLNFN